MAAEMEESYGRTVLPVSCLDLDEAQLGEILQKVLYEFPVRELDFALPRWVTMLDKGHWLQTEVYTAAMQLSEKIFPDEGRLRLRPGGAGLRGRGKRRSQRDEPRRRCGPHHGAAQTRGVL